MGNPNPKTLVGIFELTGSGFESSDSTFSTLTNNWRLRREHRQDGIAFALECLIEVSGGAIDSERIQVFASAPIEVHDWGISVLEPASELKRYNQNGFNVECGVDIPVIDLPYCLVDEGVPEGFSTCVTVRGGTLEFLGAEAGKAGEKISN